MNQEKLAILIKRYKSGNATPDEVALLDRIWSDAETRTTLAIHHTEEELANIEREMLKVIKYEIGKHKPLKKSVLHRPLFYKVAATLLILAAVSLWFYNASTRDLEVRTGFGEHQTVILPDQSEVVLNGNSVLRYASHWDENSPREVWIEGEGFFSVVHTKNHQKFVVHGAGELNVEVLGTKFNIRTRQSASEVMLAEGKVKLELGGENSAPLFLKPGELATVKDRTLSTSHVKKQHYTSWVENKLHFDHTPLSDIASLLKDTYGLTVTFSEADQVLATRELSGEISAASVDEILFAIGETLNLNIEKEGQSVVISTKLN